MMRLVWVIVVGSWVLAGCGSDYEERCANIPDTGSITVEVAMENLEDSITRLRSKDELVAFFSRHEALRDYFFSREAYPSDSVFINALYNRFTHPAFDSLRLEAKRVFGEGEYLRQQFTEAFRNLKYYYPELQVPRIQTVISGFEADLVVSDTLIIVGLDYFLGAGARYRPNMYEYMLARYEKNFVVPSALLLMGIDTRYNRTDLKDRTVLADMIAYGKAYYFAKQMMPCVPDSVFIGYSANETEDAWFNQDLIWKKLVDDEVLFSTSNQAKQKYISERPKTLEVGANCPGRIATYIGWQIVKEYARKNPSLTLQQIMAEPSAEKILRESRYRPVER